MNACLCERPTAVRIPASMTDAAITRTEAAIIRDHPDWGWLYGDMARPATPEEEARYENQRRQEAADKEAIEAAARTVADSVAESAASVAAVQDPPEPRADAVPAEDKTAERFLALHDAEPPEPALVPDAGAPGTAVIPAVEQHTEAIAAVPAEPPAKRTPKRRAS